MLFLSELSPLIREEPNDRQPIRSDRYNIFSDDAWVGGIESDISTVMVYAAADRWLRSGGSLGFVITQSVFKTKSAQGLRRLSL